MGRSGRRFNSGHPDQRVWYADHMDHKTCSCCGLSKPVSEFRWKVKAKGLRISMCRPCDKVYRARRYLSQREHILERNAASMEVRRRKVAAGVLVEAKSKVCQDCGLDRPIEDFRWKNRSLRLRVSRCFDCDPEYRAQFYRTNRGQFLANNRRQYAKLRAILDDHKRDPCMDCGASFPTYVMDLDHRDPKKKVSKVSALVYSGSETLLLAEIAKCDLVCANCHRIRTFGPPS